MLNTAQQGTIKMFEQLLLLLIIGFIVLLFKNSTPYQRYKFFRAMIIIALGIGALGLLWEITERGGRMPVTYHQPQIQDHNHA